MSKNEKEKTLKVFPSIAAGNLMHIEHEVRKIELSGADGLHFDAMDGHFVPLLTIGIPLLEQIRKITSMHIDVHIMVSNPDQVFLDYVHAGADTLCFHIEATVHAHKICAKIKEKGKRAGVALNPATHWHDIEYLLADVDLVTVMAVNPGFSHQHHLPLVHKKIKELAKFRSANGLGFEIQVDGGVNPENVALLKSLGVDSVVAGGAIFKHKDYSHAVALLK